MGLTVDLTSDKFMQVHMYVLEELVELLEVSFYPRYMFYEGFKLLPIEHYHRLDTAAKYECRFQSFSILKQAVHHKRFTAKGF